MAATPCQSTQLRSARATCSEPIVALSLGGVVEVSPGEAAVDPLSIVDPLPCGLMGCVAVPWAPGVVVSGARASVLGVLVAGGGTVSVPVCA